MMTGLGVVPLVDEGLGNSSYLVDLGDGRALVVDPSRTCAAAGAGRGPPRADRRLRGRHPPARRLPVRRPSSSPPRRRAGARPRRAGGPAVPAQRPGRRRRGRPRRADAAGAGHARAHATSTSPTCSSTARPTVGLFSGGSLLVGSAARTDLVDPGRTEELARAQYRSLRAPGPPDDARRVARPTAPGRSARRRRAAERTTHDRPRRRPPTRCCARSRRGRVRQALLGSLGSLPAVLPAAAAS